MKNPKVFHQKDARNGELGVRSGCGSSFSKTGFWGTWKWSEGKQIKEDLDRTAQHQGISERMQTRAGVTSG